MWHDVCFPTCHRAAVIASHWTLALSERCTGPDNTAGFYRNHFVFKGPCIVRKTVQQTSLNQQFRKVIAERAIEVVPCLTDTAMASPWPVPRRRCTSSLAAGAGNHFLDATISTRTGQTWYFFPRKAEQSTPSITRVRLAPIGSTRQISDRMHPSNHPACY